MLNAFWVHCHLVCKTAPLFCLVLTFIEDIASESELSLN